MMDYRSRTERTKWRNINQYKVPTGMDGWKDGRMEVSHGRSMLTFFFQSLTSRWGINHMTSSEANFRPYRQAYLAQCHRDVRDTEGPFFFLIPAILRFADRFCRALGRKGRGGQVHWKYRLKQ